jgi:hypothetical protein
MGSSVGSGDIYGTTDLERMFLTFLFSAADVVFALAFGLIAELTTKVRQDNWINQQINKLIRIEYLMSQAQFNANWKDRVKQYLTYKS